MKIFLVFFVAIFGFSLADDLDDLNKYLDCYRKALEEGVPSLNISAHDPLDLGNYTPSIYFRTTNNLVFHLMNYSFPKLTAASYHDPERVAYEYEIYWPEIKYSGDLKFEVTFSMFGWDYDISYNGTHEFTFYDVYGWGTFNFTKPGQNVPEHIDEFTIQPNISSAEVWLHEVESGETADLEWIDAENTLRDYINGFPALRINDYFNDHWIDHPEKIETLLEFCGLN